jgi:hypothetical protein
LWTQVTVLAVLFLGGGVAGAQLATRLAPDSLLAPFVGLFSLSFPFVVGMHLWLGLAILGALWRLVTRRRLRGNFAPGEVPPGSFAFVPTCVVLSGGAGFLMALFGTSLGFVRTIGLYLLIGLTYGMACWLMARSGYLPFPEE